MGKHVIINIGRQFGSGGRRIADELGRKLGITVYDNELISRAAERSGLSPEAFKGSDERKRSLSLGSFFGSGRVSGRGGSMNGGMFNDGELFRVQSETIRELASEGNAIFVGRASDYVLRDMDCLDVFICAPESVRVQRVSERMGIDPDEARRLVARKDAGRKDYYDFFTFSDWGVASNYDLCVDSSILGIEGTAEFIIDFARRRGMV